MLKIYDTNHNAIGHIVKYKDLKVAERRYNWRSDSFLLHTWQDIMKSVKSIILRLRMLSM